MRHFACIWTDGIICMTFCTWLDKDAHCIIMMFRKFEIRESMNLE
jgi:hypothetical protein